MMTMSIVSSRSRLQAPTESGFSVAETLTFTALAVDWRTARQVSDERREELLRQGWQPFA